jgi:hypothetical protein
MPLAVAAASPRLRFAGEQVAVFYFPGAASCVRASPSSATSAPFVAADTGLPAQPHEFPCDAFRYTMMTQNPPLLRRVRGVSFTSLTPAMRHSRWWFGRATPVSAHRATAAFTDAMGEAEGGGGWAAAPLQQQHDDACLPLCVEVVAPRVTEPNTAPATVELVRSGQPWWARWWGWLGHPFSGVLADKRCSRAGGGSGKNALLLPISTELQAAAYQFVALIEQLWCEWRCPLVELVTERCPIALAEWMLSPDLHPTAALPSAPAKITSPAGDAEALTGGSVSLARVQRAFSCTHTLKCRGRVGQGSADAVSAATAVDRELTPPSTTTGVGERLALSLHFTAVQPQLRVLDLSGSAVACLDGLEAFPLLEKVVLMGCARLSSLSPLGLAPALREIVASQSGINELDGLARSTTLVSLSLYGCLNLTDVGACGRIPTLRDLFISESTVERLEGLQGSHSLVRLGMRYCDVDVFTALSSISSLRVLHASSSTVTSVAALQHCVSLEVVEVTACAQLVDLGPLGSAPRLRELDASGSGVRHIDGLRHSASLEKLLLSQCVHLEDIGHLSECVHLRQLGLTGTGVRSLDGLAGAPALAWLDVSFCRHLANFAVLLQLPQLRHVATGGCTTALRCPEEVQRVLESLCGRQKKVVVV